MFFELRSLMFPVQSELLVTSITAARHLIDSDNVDVVCDSIGFLSDLQALHCAGAVFSSSGWTVALANKSR
jgi:hypothetical protein